MRYLLVLLLTGCSIDWKTSESDYDIYADVQATENGCRVTIQRKEGQSKGSKESKLTP